VRQRLPPGDEGATILAEDAEVTDQPLEVPAVAGRGDNDLGRKPGAVAFCSIVDMPGQPKHLLSGRLVPSQPLRRP
jgi:hypothetical protein